MRKMILGTLIAVVLVGGALLIERSVRVNRAVPINAEESGDSAGQLLPLTAQITSFADRKKTTLASFKGKVVLINFWASWCEACMAEMPSIQKLYDTYKSKGLEVIAVNLDDNPDRVVASVVKRLGITFPVYLDTDGELNRIFNVVAIPFNVVADRNQKIIWSESGERDWASDEVQAEIKKLL